MFLFEFKMLLRWCTKCGAEKEQTKLPSCFVHEECGTVNDGTHPAEKSRAVLGELFEGLELISKNCNKRRIFPQSLHGEHRYTTAVSSRSIKLKIFRRSKHTSV